MRRYRFARYGIDFDLKSDYDKASNFILVANRECDKIENSLKQAEKILLATLRENPEMHARDAKSAVAIAIQNIKRIRVDTMGAIASINDAKRG